jgi:hypothetical protein
MKRFVRTVVTILCVLLLPYASSLVFAQSFYESSPQAAPQIAQPQLPQLLGPEQLDNLVAPVALYPDPLLSQVLAASTYPLEIVEAQQWLQQAGNLRGQALIEAAKRQNWDPSVQALIAMPDVMALFSRDIRWTTELGNAFLDQQADVMDSIQRLRAQASNNGRLTTTPQQIVTTETQNQQSAIQIQPANPQVIYPPIYDPATVWGPPASGEYPALSYPQNQYESGYGSGYGSGSGYGFGSGINVGQLVSGLVGGLAGSFGGWGWVLNWFTHALFFNGFGSQNSSGGLYSNGSYGAPAVWVHNPVHRLGVPYSNGFLPGQNRRFSSGARFGSSRFSDSGFATSRFAASARSTSAGRSASDGWRSFGGGAPASTRSSSEVGRGFQPGNQRAESYNRAAAPTSRSGYASNIGGSQRNNTSYLSAKPQQMASNFRGSAQSTRTVSPESRFAAAPRTSSQNFSSRASAAPRQFSQPHGSSPHFSSPHYSAPRGSSHASAPRHSGGGHSTRGSNKGSSRGSHKH